MRQTQHLVSTMAFGKRDMSKNAGLQSLQVRPPGDGPSVPLASDNASERPTKSKPHGVMLPIIAGGIVLALIALWIMRNFAG